MYQESGNSYCSEVNTAKYLPSRGKWLLCYKTCTSLTRVTYSVTTVPLTSGLSLWSPTSSEFCLQCFCLTEEELSNQCRSKKIGNDGETKETEPDVLQRQQRDHARHAAQTVSERQATSQWKSISERGAETPEERETRNRSSAIRHLEGGDWRCDGITFNFHTGLSHIYYLFIPVLSLPKTDCNDTERSRTPCNKKAPVLTKPLLPPHTGYYPKHKPWNVAHIQFPSTWGEAATNYSVVLWGGAAFNATVF